MNEKIFRKKSVEKMPSPEQLNDYIPLYDHLREKRDHPVLELLDQTAVSEEDPCASVMNRETLEELACALERLPQTQRDILILLYYKKLDRKKVAEMFGISYGQLRYLHDKALKRLGELLRT